MRILRWFNITKVVLAILIQIYSGCAVPTDDHPHPACCLVSKVEPADKTLDPAAGLLRVRYEQLPLLCRKQQEDLANMAPPISIALTSQRL
jgi:hypothetical protein